MTKALKLLYLIDETSFMRTGVSVTWLDYKIWEMGPVAEELYNELRYDQSLLQNGEPINLERFIQTEKLEGPGGHPQITIRPNGHYSLDEFSPYEMELIDNVVDRFGTYTAKQLINLLHEKNTLWHKYVTDNSLELNFQVYGKKSNHTIDFAELIKDDPIKQLAAQSAFESMQMQDEIDNL
ncbi:MAG TPA: Panacea domain-containing protein [Puia sp.]|nr:Panacea domain-containing protein [Puia sp.]